MPLFLKTQEAWRLQAQVSAGQRSPAHPAPPPSFPFPACPHHRLLLVSEHSQGGTPGLPGAWTAQQLVSVCRELTPLQEASLQNQKLKAAYEARMARLDPSQALQKTSLVSGSQGGSGLPVEEEQALFSPSLPRPCPCSGR